MSSPSIQELVRAARKTVRDEIDAVEAEIARHLLAKYSPDQPRDEHGRFGSGGGGESHPKPKVWQNIFEPKRSQEAQDKSHRFLRSVATKVFGGGSADPKTPGLQYQNALLEYTDWGYSKINDALRFDGASVEDGATTRLIQEAILSSETTKDMVAYRGTAAFTLRNLKEGDTFTDKGFVSTSVFRDIAEGFARPALGTSNETLLGNVQIYIPSGSNALPTLGVEGEVILPAGSQFKVDSVTPSSFGSEYKMTYVGHEASAEAAKAVAEPKHQKTGGRYVWGNDDIVVQRKTAKNLAKYSPDQPRDDHGRFGSSGGESPTTKFKTWDDVKTWGDKNGIKIDAQGLQDTANMTPRAMGSVVNRIDAMDAKFPGIKKELSSIGPYESKTALAAVSRNDTGSNLLIAAKTGDAYANPEAYKVAMLETVKPSTDGTPRWSTCVGDHPDDTINHEMGHVVQNMMQREGLVAEPRSNWNTKTNPYVAAASDAGLLTRTSRTGQGPDLSFLAGYSISSYASTSPFELHAEALSLMQRPDIFATLTTEQQDTFNTYVDAINKRTGQTMIKEQGSGTSPKIIEDDFNLGPDFWERFYELANKGNVAKYNPDQPRDDHGRFGSGETSDRYALPDFAAMDANGTLGVIQAAKWFEERGIKIPDRMQLAGMGMTAKDLGVVAQSIVEMDKKFPGTMQEIAQIGPYLDTKSFAGVKNLRGEDPPIEGSILAISRTGIDAMHNPEAAGLGHSVAQSPQEIFTHELGHVVQNMTLDHLGVSPEETAGQKGRWSVQFSYYSLGEKASIFERAAQSAGYLSKGQDTSGRPLFKTIEKDISRYAAKSPAEFHSEVLTLLSKGAVDSLPAGSQARIAKYVDTLNELAGRTVIKAPLSPKGTANDTDPYMVGCDFRFDPNPDDPLFLNKAAESEMAKYNPDQPRDSHGRFGSGDGEDAPKVMDWQRSGPPDVSANKARDWMESHIDSVMSSWRSSIGSEPLTKLELAMLSNYQGDGHQDLNEHLRAGGSIKDDPDGIGKTIQGAFQHSETNEPVVVFRGLSGFQPDANIGDVITDRGFPSTSLVEAVSKFTFSENQAESQVMQINLPTGTPAIGLASLESEILLPAGSQFRVDAKPGAGSEKWVVTYVGQAAVKSLAKTQVGRRSASSKFAWNEGDIEIAKPAKKSSDSDKFTPPRGVREEARRAVEWIKEGHAGANFTPVGRGRAGDLAIGRSVSLDIIKRMASYLARHEVDKKGQGWSPGEDGYPSPGRVAWAAWGGDAAVSWTNGILKSNNVAKYSPDEERDERGRWTGGGIDGTSSSPKEIADRLAAGKSVTVEPSQVVGVAKYVASKSDPETRKNAQYDKANLNNLHLTTGRDVFAQGPKTGIYQRAAMPQIPSSAKPAFLESLSKAGIGVTREAISPNDLKPSQRDYSTAGSSNQHELLGTKGMFTGNVTPKDGDRILVSKDNYIIDGHHRWAGYQMEALTNPDVRVPVIKIDASRKELIGNGDGGTKNADFVGRDGIVNKFVDSAGLARAKFGEVKATKGIKSVRIHGGIEFDPEHPKDKAFLDHLDRLGNESNNAEPFIWNKDHRVEDFGDAIKASRSARIAALYKAARKQIAAEIAAVESEVFKYSPDQARDSRGRFGSGDSGSIKSGASFTGKWKPEVQARVDEQLGKLLDRFPEVRLARVGVVPDRPNMLTIHGVANASMGGQIEVSQSLASGKFRAPENVALASQSESGLINHEFGHLVADTIPSDRIMEEMRVALGYPRDLNGERTTGLGDVLRGDVSYQNPGFQRRLELQLRGSYGGTSLEEGFAEAFADGIGGGKVSKVGEAVLSLADEYAGSAKKGVLAKYSPDQPRDDHGRFGSGDSGSIKLGRLSDSDRPTPEDIVSLKRVEMQLLARVEAGEESVGEQLLDARRARREAEQWASLPAGAVPRNAEQSNASLVGMIPGLIDDPTDRTAKVVRGAKTYERKNNQELDEFAVSIDQSGVLWRGVSDSEYAQIMSSGFIVSDRRGAIVPSQEGTNLSNNAATAREYLPVGGEGRVIAIDASKVPDPFLIGGDDYVRTREPIPVDAILAVSELFGQNKDGFDYWPASTAVKGDVKGHEFHGNQWTGGGGGDPHLEAFSRNLAKYSPDQPRDSHGRFGSGDGDSKLDLSRYERVPTKEDLGAGHYQLVYGNAGPVPGEKAVIPPTPTPANLENGIYRWKQGPSSVRAYLPEVLGQFGSPHNDWTARSRAECAAVLNAVANDSKVTEETLYRGVNLKTISSMEEGQKEFAVGSKINMPISGFSERPELANQFSHENTNGIKQDGLPVVFEVAPGAKALPIDGSLYEGDYVDERESIMGGELRVDKVGVVGSGENQHLHVNVTQTDTLHAPPGGFR